MSLKDSIEVSKVVQEISKLKKKQRMEVLKKLVLLLDRPQGATKRKPKLTDLAGLGAEVWKGVDPDEYVKNIRAEWDR
jgi:hypothetical protein